ncbi:DUF2391 family protein [bacterium]|nr:MAG: DUF2391 family protein [bacterium]
MADRPSVKESLKEYSRGIAGGLLFSLPVLYTMEVWAHGILASPERLALGLVATFGLLCLYNAYAGLREDHSKAEILVDSVEELGLGLALSAAILVLLGRIGPDSTFIQALGLVVTQGCTTAIGVSVGTAQLGGDTPQRDDRPTLPSQIAISLCGAVLIAANVAPTEEILLLGVESSPLHSFVMLIACLALAMFALRMAEVRGHRDFEDCSAIPRMIMGPVVTVAVALFASGAMLWWYGRLSGDGLGAASAQIVALGLPATLGASVGRALLQA